MVIFHSYVSLPEGKDVHLDSSKDFHLDSSDNRFQDSATRRIAKYLRYSSCAWYATIIDTNTDKHRNRCRTDDGKYPNEFACNALSDVHVLETKNCQL